jgi:hypothetical protein
MQRLFGPFSFLDIDARSIPFHEVSGFIPQRHISHKQPAIFSIRPPYAYFALRRMAILERCVPIGDEPVSVIGMNYGFPIPSQRVLLR